MCFFVGVVTACELDVQAAVPDTATHLPALKFHVQCCWEIFICVAGEVCPCNQKLYSLSSSMSSGAVIKHGANFIVLTCIPG